MKNSEREGEMEVGPSQNEGKNKSVVTVVGYNRDNPPQDDRCPICFDGFHFPCSTSCGHWFCSSCILMFWRHSANFKPCKCPICGGLIKNLAPESSVLIQQGEEVGKILKHIERYNHLNNGGWYGLFMKATAQPRLIRRRLREYPNTLILDCIFNSLHLIGLLLGILYKIFGFDVFPYRGLGIALFFDMCGHALVLVLVLDIIWHGWINRRRAMHLAGVQQME